MQLTRLRQDLKGKILAQPIFDERRILLINSGIVLNSDLILSLSIRGLKYIYIEEEGTEEIRIEDPLPRQAERSVAHEVNDTFNKIRTLSGGDKTAVSAVFNKLSNDGRFKQLAPKGNFRKTVNQMVSDLFSADLSNLSSFSLSMLGTNPLSHTMDVTLLTILLAKRFHYDFKDLISLATAALLHDAGQQLLTLPENKHLYEYTPEEYEIYKQHPAEGYRLLDSFKSFSLLEMQTVLQHHERQDGSGFPNGFKGNNLEPVKSASKIRGMIFRWAEILAVADRYVQYCSGNLTPIPLTPQQAVLKVLEEEGTILNSMIVNELVNLINVFPLGTPVKIVDSNKFDLVGYQGVVCRVNERHLDRPEVIMTKSPHGQKIDPFKIDFKNDRMVKLEMAA